MFYTFWLFFSITIYERKDNKQDNLTKINISLSRFIYILITIVLWFFHISIKLILDMFPKKTPPHTGTKIILNYFRRISSIEKPKLFSGFESTRAGK